MIQTTEDQLAKLRELLAAKRSILLPINAVVFTYSDGIVDEQIGAFVALFVVFVFYRFFYRARPDA